MSAKAIDGRKTVAKAIKADIYSELRDQLTKPINKNSTKTWAGNFITELLESARKDPNGPIGQLIAKQIMSQDIIEKLDSETDKYLARDIDFLEYRLLKTLYDEQRNVFLDTDRKKIVLGSRRIGKTELAARLLLKDAVQPGHKALFISLKLENAKRQCYPLVLDLATSLGLSITHESKLDGEITFANGSEILFKGNKDKGEADKFQGYKFSCIVIDECQSQRNLRYLLDDILGPTLMDYEDSRLVLIGTPPRIAKTYVEDIWKNYKGWKKYSWNMAKNPYLHNVEAEIQRICEEKGLTEDAPFIQREYFGQFVYDVEAMVMKGYKTCKGIPDSFIPTNVAIGVDYGGTDFNAMISLAYNVQTKQAYVISECKFNKGTASEIVEMCKKSYEYAVKFCKDRNPDMDMTKIGLYCDTSNLPLTFELGTRYNLPVYNCYKYDKTFALQQLADWCRAGKVLITENSTLADEFERTVYKRDEQDNILPEIDDDIFHPDALDALLYASRQYAFDCGEDGGGESSDKKNKEEAHKDTLPEWMREMD